MRLKGYIVFLCNRHIQYFVITIIIYFVGNKINFSVSCCSRDQEQECLMFRTLYMFYLFIRLLNKNNFYSFIFEKTPFISLFCDFIFAFTVTFLIYIILLK